MTAAITGPADLRDQQWLDGRIAAIDEGIEAVLDIARNWTDGRNLARLHPGTAAQDYILARVKSPLGRGVVEPLLIESNWSNRQIAAVAGVSRNDVNELALSVPVDRPAGTLGADGKLRSAPRPRLAPEPYEYVPRTVTATVIDKPAFRTIAATFERDLRRLLEGYSPHLEDERFSARFGAVIAAIREALEA